MSKCFLVLAIFFVGQAFALGSSSIVVSSGEQDILSMKELDPHEPAHEHLVDIIRNIYDTLYTIEKDGSLLESLAEACEVSSFMEDVEYIAEMDVRCKIRDNVFFHDGLKLEAKDVVFSVQRAKGSKTLSGNLNIIKDVKVLGDSINRTVEFKVVYKVEGVDDPQEWLFERFKRILARFIYVVRADYFVSGSSWALEYPVGTGPFYFNDWKLWDKKDSRSQIILKKNKSYWRDGYPKIETLFFRFLPESLWFDSLSKRTVSLLFRIPYEQYIKLSELNADNGLFLIKKRLAYSYQYILFTPNSKFKGSKELLRAFYSAINRNRIAKLVLGKDAIVNSGKALALSSVFPEKFMVKSYNPKESRKLISLYLKKNGFKINKIPLSILVSELPEDLSVAEELKKQLSIAGFIPKINVLRWDAYRIALNKEDLNKYDLILYNVEEHPFNLTPKVRGFLSNGGVQLYQKYVFYAMARPDIEDKEPYAGILREFNPSAEGPLSLFDAE